MRKQALAEARTWLGTPYRHQASVKGAGADCLGLIRGVYRALYGDEPETPPAYTASWAEDLRKETLLGAARRHLSEIDIGDAEPGDVLLFRLTTQSPAKHCAILSAPRLEGGRLIHAYWNRSVCETSYVPWWRRRTAAAFCFPSPPRGEE